MASSGILDSLMFTVNSTADTMSLLMLLSSTSLVMTDLFLSTVLMSQSLASLICDLTDSVTKTHEVIPEEVFPGEVAMALLVEGAEPGVEALDLLLGEACLGGDLVNLLLLQLQRAPRVAHL